MDNGSIDLILCSFNFFLTIAIFMIYLMIQITEIFSLEQNLIKFVKTYFFYVFHMDKIDRIC